MRPVASLLITRRGTNIEARSQPSDNAEGVVFLRFWTFLEFENWSSQWLSRRNLDFKIMMTLLCGQSSNLHGKSTSFLGRLPKVDLIIIEGRNVRPPVRPPYVRPSTKRFFNLNEIWYIGRGR